MQRADHKGGRAGLHGSQSVETSLRGLMEVSLMTACRALILPLFLQLLRHQDFGIAPYTSRLDPLEVADGGVDAPHGPRGCLQLLLQSPQVVSRLGIPLT